MSEWSRSQWVGVSEKYRLVQLLKTMSRLGIIKNGCANVEYNVKLSSGIECAGIEIDGLAYVLC